MKTETKTKLKRAAKRIGLESIAIGMGCAFGGVGRATGAEYISAIPVALELYEGVNPWTLLKYGVGVALVNADRIYPIAEQLLKNYFFS